MADLERDLMELMAVPLGDYAARFKAAVAGIDPSPSTSTTAPPLVEGTHGADLAPTGCASP